MLAPALPSRRKAGKPAAGKFTSLTSESQGSERQKRHCRRDARAGILEVTARGQPHRRNQADQTRGLDPGRAPQGARNHQEQPDKQRGPKPRCARARSRSAPLLRVARSPRAADAPARRPPGAGSIRLSRAGRLLCGACPADALPAAEPPVAARSRRRFAAADRPASGLV